MVVFLSLLLKEVDIVDLNLCPFEAEGGERERGREGGRERKTSEVYGVVAREYWDGGGGGGAMSSYSPLCLGTAETQFLPTQTRDIVP